MTYVKNHDPWTASDPITVSILDNFETIHEEVQAYLDSHNHDALYYTRAQMESTYHNIGSQGHGSGIDADLIYHPDGSMHAADFGTAGGDITGGIITWYGIAANVPAGWHICDGTDGTPDLRDCFIVGAGGAFSPGTTGGSNTFTAQGSIIVGEHTLTVDELGPHKHPYNDYYSNSSPSTRSGNNLSGPAAPYLPPQYTGYTGGGMPHDHDAEVTANAVDALPPCYALYYIQKI